MTTTSHQSAQQFALETCFFDFFAFYQHLRHWWQRLLGHRHWPGYTQSVPSCLYTGIAQIIISACTQATTNHQPLPVTDSPHGSGLHLPSSRDWSLPAAHVKIQQPQPPVSEPWWLLDWGEFLRHLERKGGSAAPQVRKELQFTLWGTGTQGGAPLPLASACRELLVQVAIAAGCFGTC